MARVHVLNQVCRDEDELLIDNGTDWTLWFQECRYVYDPTDKDHDSDQWGYRFIWKRPDGSLQAARGQARLPSIDQATKLMQKALKVGWGKKPYE